MEKYLVIDIKTLNLERLLTLNRLGFIGSMAEDGQVILAGGALRCLVDPNEEIVDYDLFFKNTTDLVDTRNELEAFGFRKVFECPQGELYTYVRKSMKVQLIVKRYYKDVKDLLDSFDFTACQIAIFEGNLYIAREAIRDIKRKRLNLNTIEYPVATLNRIQKYIKKGYTVNEAFYQELVYRISEKEWPSELMHLYVD